MKTAIYTRVSSEEQTKGWSLSEQRRQCIEKAKSLGFSKPKVYEDPGYSGALAERPALQKLITSKPDVIIVWRLDRLGRDALNLLTLRSQFRIISATESIDTEISDKLIFGIKALLAEEERDAIRQRTKMGLARARREGKHIGQIPFGYRRTKDKTIEADPVNFPKLQRIFKLRNQGLSGYAIAKEIGIPSGTVYHILQSKTYGQQSDVKTSGHSRKPPKYTLTGVCICPECGYRLGVAGRGKGLKCPRGCFNISYKKAWDATIAIIEAELGELKVPNQTDDTHEVELMTRIADIETQISRLTDAYARGVIDIDELAYHRKDLDKKLEVYNKDLEKERSRQRDHMQRTGTLKFIDVFWARHEAGDIQFVNRFLRILFPQGFAPFSKAPQVKGGYVRSPVRPVQPDILRYLREITAAPRQSEGPPTQG